ncbi:MAG: c-type cytochrome, partial [Planctomycetales bacterium]|nr:c-type cytochrome [Planctomycetales bacterium]
VRLITDAWPLDDVMGPTAATAEMEHKVRADCDGWLPVLCELARREDGGLVRLALASTLQRLPVERRIELEAPLMARADDAEDHDLPLLVWYGLMPTADEHAESLAALAASPGWPTTQRLIARRLAEGIDRTPRAVEILLARVVESPDPAERRNLLSGVAAGLKGWRHAAEPGNWAEVVAKKELRGDAEAAAIVRDMSVLFGDGRALDGVRQLVLDEDAEIGVRRSALETLVERGDESVAEICLPLLADPRLNLLAARGLAKSNDLEAARGLIENYRKFRAPLRPQVISILVSRAVFAAELLNAVEEGLISSHDLTAFDVRQIASLGDDALNRRVAELWGEVRDTPDAKRERIEELKRRFTPIVMEDADLSNGRRLFQHACAKCHRLFGVGESIGPDLTGGNRTNLDYLLENVVDPSAVVSKDFRMSVVVLADGRVRNGLVIAQNEKTLTLQTQTEQVTINRGTIEEVRVTSQSPMPEGLLDNLAFDEARDLAAYLMQPAQVPLPNGKQ